MEIERKFRLKKLPPKLPAGKTVIQSYFFSYPGEMRIRKQGKNHQITVKSDGDLDREEWETVIPDWVYELIYKQSHDNDIKKTRYKIDEATCVDEYKSYLEGLITFEVEFPSIAAAKKFKLPKWADDAVEVTEAPEYKNKNLAKVDKAPEWPTDISK